MDVLPDINEKRSCVWLVLYFEIVSFRLDKFVLISLICKLTHIFSRKKPNVTCYQIIKKIIGEQLPENFIQALAIICEDFSYNCNDFPNFGFEDKEMPKEIKRILMNYLPF